VVTLSNTSIFAISISSNEILWETFIVTASRGIIHGNYLYQTDSDAVAGQKINRLIR